MEVEYSSETLIDFEGTTRRYITEARTFHNQCCEYLISYRLNFDEFKFGELAWVARSSDSELWNCLRSCLKTEEI
jgi:hypothetical protein